jgi:hypothetical protein
LTRAIAVGATVASLALAGGAAASSGGVGAGSGGSSAGSGSQSADNLTGDQNLTPAKYVRLWERVSTADRRWAHRVAECETGHDPNLTALGGDYRGAFMFTWDAWKTSPRSPGGDPIDYSYKTQAVVAVALKARDGTRPWPVCG